MNLKRIFGAILTVLGTISLIYAAYIFANTSTGEQNIKTTSIYGVIGLIFFIAGISLVKKTRDDSRV
jgi:predicted Na+-dependent transporter